MKKRYWELNHPVLRILQHLVFWVLSFFVFLHLTKTGAKAEKVDYIYTALFQLSIIPAVYINLEFLLVRLGKGRIRLLYIFSIAVLIALFAWINYSFFDQWSSKVLPDYFFISYFTWWQVVLFFSVYIIITSLLKLSKSWFIVSELQKELLEKEKQKSEVELKALKAQINPHFFFNTLNNIYSMSLDKDDRLPATILQLSELMRYFLYEAKDNFIPLEKELAVVNNYIALQKLRSNKQLLIEIKKEGELVDQKIAPLLLITFLENAFKHGAKGSSGNAFIRLSINIQKSQLNFIIENNKGIIDETEPAAYKGLGLENVKRQLELLYPGKHVLDIKQLTDHFVVQLQLNI
jgi:two-component system, LytTR family, sensor kinase